MAKAKQLTDGKAVADMTPAEIQMAQHNSYLDLVRELSTNKDVDPGKLEKLLDLQERVMDRNAKQAFEQAMQAAQSEMQVILTDKENPHARSRYATYKALDKAVRPIYSKHGFSVTFNTGKGEIDEPVPEQCLRVWMFIAHVGGHTKALHVDIPVETTGSQGSKMMTRIHATGSAMSYGKRYLVIFGFNLAIADTDDDDGNKAGGVGAKQQKETKSKGPQPKSARKETVEGEVTGNQDAKDKYPAVVPTRREQDRIKDSSLATMRSNMKRLGVSEEKFEADFGFPLAETHKNGLNSLIDWMKEASGA